MEKIFRTIFESFISRTVIAILGIIGTIISVYAFIQEKKVDLRYEIIANTNVLDFNAEVGKLEVVYDSTNLKQSKENLRIYTIKVINNGDEHIIKEFFDENDPLGLKINGGKIIEKPEVIQASNKYLSNNLKVIDYLPNKITFSQVILESGEYFVIKLLVLHKKNNIPSILSLGKIAGQKEITVVNSIDIKENRNFFSQVYNGNIWIQLLRLISYFIIAVIIILLIVFINEQIETIKERKRKNTVIVNFKNIPTYEYTKMDDAIFDRYKKDGSRLLTTLKKYVKNEKILNEKYNRAMNQGNMDEFKFRKFNIPKFNDDMYYIQELIKDGIIYKDGTQLKINSAMKDTLYKFIEFIGPGEVKFTPIEYNKSDFEEV